MGCKCRKKKKDFLNKIRKAKKLKEKEKKEDDLRIKQSNIR